MKLSLEQLSARMRQGETIPSRQTAQVALALSIPSILEQLVVTAMGYLSLRHRIVSDEIAFGS